MTSREHPDLERILDLVNGLLATSVRRETLDHVRGCAACAGRLQEFARTHERAYALAAEALGRASADRIGHQPRSGRVLQWPGRRSSQAALAAAALLVVAGGATLVWNASRSTPGRGESVAWLPTPEANVLTRDFLEDAPDPRIAAGLEAYRNHDAAAANRLLGRARAEGSTEQVRLMYLGNSELQLGRPRAALETLRQVDLSRIPEPWRSEAQWSLGLAFARTGQSRAADSLWLLLSDRPGGIGERARQQHRDLTTAPGGP